MAYQNIYFLHYNNYYNRIVKREKSLDDYRLYQVGDPLLETNFNPNDGVNTMHYVNWELQIPETMPDYCVVQEIDTGEINSCWFVIEAVRTLQGQMQFTLRRDLIADFYDEVTSATSFIEKATLSPSDPFIFNREDFTVNQIKKGEDPLKDPGGIAWIVGYLSSDRPEITIEDTAAYQPYEVLNKSYFTQYEGGYRGALSSITLDVTANISYSSYTPWYAKFSFYSGVKRPTGIGSDIGVSTYIGPDSSSKGVEFTEGFNDTAALTNAVNELASNTTRYVSGIESSIFSLVSTRSRNEVNQFLRYNNKILLDQESGNYYKVTITRSGDSVTEMAAPSGSVVRERMIQIIEDAIDDGAALEITRSDPTGLYFRVNVENYNVTVEDFLPGKVTVKIAGSREKLRDAPYSMFAIPYEQSNIYGNDTSFDSNAEHSWVAAQAIARHYSGSGALYDLQLLPYCPITEAVKDGGINLNVLEENVDFNYIFYTTDSEGTNRTSVILWATRSTFTIDIPYEINITDPKVENQCDLYRLSSPNYSGIFEFSAAKNGGVRRFNVDCTYKPIAPYIHVNPDFGGLYGRDYNDSRGLVCTGDFSLPIINDAWETYQIQNKNYSEIFARQISNMEVNNAVQREREIWGTVAGAVGAATSGGITGALSGAGPIGAIAGATIGGGLSAIAGARDVKLSDTLRSEALDYTKDMYGYNLGNIQALPYSLAKTSAITANNKLFPFLEYYSCTDEEKQAFRDKLKYNGMTVMRIGQIGTYLQLEKSYIKARIIRMENLTDEFHLLNEIAAEMAKGVFI